jgi:hypothetical protein
MPWTLGGIRIFVSESKEEGGQIVPRLQPLSGATILQIFGYESDIRTLGAVVVGDTDKDALKSLRTTGSGYILESPEYPTPSGIGSFVVKNVSINRLHSICQTLRSDLATDAPVYQAEIQLYK